MPTITISYMQKKKTTNFNCFYVRMKTQPITTKKLLFAQQNTLKYKFLLIHKVHQSLSHGLLITKK